MTRQIRKQYTDIGYKPFLFFVIFGVTENEMQVSESKHHVDAFPEGLDVHVLCRKEHSDYIDGFFEGDLGKILKESDYELYDKCRKAENCVIIKGDVIEDSTFDYMRNVIGIIQTFIEQGAVGILDFLTFSLFSPQNWTERFFEKEINAQNHVKILFSKEDDGFWMHTRGMIEFGRPDYSIRGVDEADFDEYEKLLNQMIFHGGQGVFFDGVFRLHTYSGNAYKVRSKFVDDFENLDFNNAYCNVNVEQKED